MTQWRRRNSAPLLGLGASDSSSLFEFIGECYFLFFSFPFGGGEKGEKLSARHTFSCAGFFLRKRPVQSRFCVLLVLSPCGKGEDGDVCEWRALKTAE